MSTSIVIVLMMLVVTGAFLLIVSNSGPRVTIIKDERTKDGDDA